MLTKLIACYVMIEKDEGVNSVDLVSEAAF